MIRATLLYGLLLVALLTASWKEWTDEPEVDRGDKVELLAGKMDSITEIRWTSEKSEATLTRRSDAQGDYIWVDFTRWLKKPVIRPPADDATDQSPIELDEPEPVAKHSVFKASDKADRLWKDLSPMLALRRLEVTDPDKLEEIGLAHPAAKLEVVRGEKTQTLEVGGKAYGSGNIYVRREYDGQVYLVDRELLKNLKAANLLADHRMLGIARQEVASAVITSGRHSISATQRHPDDKAKATWVLSDDPDSAPEQLATWMGMALRLQGMKYADPDDMPEDLEPRFTLQLLRAKGKSQTLEVFQVGKSGQWYGRSEHTRGLVRLVRSAAKSLSDDVESVLESGD